MKNSKEGAGNSRGKAEERPRARMEDPTMEDSTMEDPNEGFPAEDSARLIHDPRAHQAACTRKLKRETEDLGQVETGAQAFNDLLRLLSEASSRKEYLDAAVEGVRRQTGCRCVGIRILDEKGMIPYESHIGFSREFWESENWLSTTRDRCVCTRIVAEQTGPSDAPYLTRAGSFLCNDMPALATALTQKDKRSFRGACVKHGFKSIAVIPVCHGARMAGAIHLADEREGMVSAKQVEFIESLAKLIGAAIYRFNIQDRLQQNYDTQNVVNSLLQMSLEDVSLDELLGRALDQLLSIPWLSFQSTGSIFLVEDKPEVLVMKAQRGLSAEVRVCCRQVPFGKCICGQAILRREIQLIRCPDGHHEPLSEPAPHSHYCIPIHLAGRAIGLINLYAHIDHLQERRELEFLTAVANTLAGIIQRKKAAETLMESERQLRHLSSQLLKAQEDERKRLACEFHDSIGSSLSAIKFNLESTRQQLGKDSAARESLDALIDMTQQAIEESRRIMADLRPMLLDDHGIIATIGWFCRRCRTIYSDIYIEQQIDIEEHEIPEPLKIVIFRVMQEALNNICKHSKAELVEITLAKRDGRIELLMEDNGEGFDMDAVLAGKGQGQGQEKGFGLTTMKERTELSGGTFKMESVPGEGTVVRASWPLGDE